MVEALAIAVSYALFDYFVAGPFHLVTYNPSNSMTSWLAALFVSVPQGAAAALLGWFAVRQGIGGLRALVATGLLLLAVRVALHWRMNVFAVSDVVMPTLLFESLIVSLAFATAASLSRRVKDRRNAPSWQTVPAVWLAVVLASLALGLTLVVQPLQWLMLLSLGKAPVEAAPLLMSIVPFAVFFAASWLIARRRWLSCEGCFIAWVFVVACHVSQWALKATYADDWLAQALMWVPVLATATAFAAGFLRGRRMRSRPSDAGSPTR